MTSTPIENRVLKLEMTVDSHSDDLKELRDTSKSLSSALQGIEKSLQQIKWLAIGAAIAIFGKELGVANVLKVIFGV
jgi:hypothetical protein